MSTPKYKSINFKGTGLYRGIASDNSMDKRIYSEDVYLLYLRQYKRDGITTNEDAIKSEIDLTGD